MSGGICESVPKACRVEIPMTCVYEEVRDGKFNPGPLIKERWSCDPRRDSAVMEQIRQALARDAAGLADCVMGRVERPKNVFIRYGSGPVDKNSEPFDTAIGPPFYFLEGDFESASKGPGVFRKYYVYGSFVCEATSPVANRQTPPKSGSGGRRRRVEKTD